MEQTEKLTQSLFDNNLAKSARDKAKHFTNPIGAAIECRNANSVLKEKHYTDRQIIEGLTQYYFIYKQFNLEADGYERANRCALQEFERSKNFINGDRIWKWVKTYLENNTNSL